MKSSDHRDDQVLERNVETLLEAGGEAPRIADTSRARIRAGLVAKFGKERRTRSPYVAVGLGLAATAAGAVIVTQLVGGPARDEQVETAEAKDGATWIADTGAKVTRLGPRRLAVEGAALVDVEPGQGTFTVETARGTIEVVGTRFLVDARAERTTTAVVRGSVRLASSDGSVLLHAGEQGVAEPGRPPSRGPAPRLSHLASWAAAARKQQEHAVRPLRNGTLFAREPNAPWVPESPLPIAKLGVDIVVEDQVARVALDQTFHNPAPQAMEGMYRFAIPPDASLQRLAMYVDGKLTESAVVERMQARRIYEDIVYRRLDPALLEWAGTGRLSLKVYPLPPKEDKRLLLAYTQSLPKLYDDWTLAVPLPEVDLPVGELAFDVRIKGCANCEVTSPSHAIGVQRTGDDAVVSYREASARIGDSLVLRVRDTRKTSTVARHEDAAKQRFVLLRTKPQLAREARAYRPRTWVILDDVSASRDALALRAQHDLIDGFLRELDEEDKVAIVAFDVAARQKLAPTRVLDVDRKAIRAALAAEGGVGATDFGVALDAATKLLAGVPAEDARVVYLGDGVISSGARQLDALRARLAGKAQFIGVGIGDGPDTQTIEALASATGGYATTIDLADDVGWRAFDLIAALHTPRVTALDARLVDASGALVPATVYLRSPQLADGEELELVGKLAGDGVPAAVELTGTLDGKPWTQRVALEGGAASAGYLPRLWAQRHITARLLAKHEPVTVPPCAAATTRATAALKPPVCKTEQEARAERDEAIRQEVVALGKQYFLLSRHTSLLVLENDAMYKRYGVTKGAGDTWAPYAAPATIPVKKQAVVTDVASDAELVRRPMQLFYRNHYTEDPFLAEGRFGRIDRTTALEMSRSTGMLGAVATRGSLGLGPTTPRVEDKAKAEPSSITEREEQAPRRSSARPDEDASGALAGGETRDVVFADELGGLGTIGTGAGSGFGRGGGGTRFRGVSAKSADIGWDIPAVQYPSRLGYPNDAGYDDLTAFVPALVQDGADAWRKELEIAAGGAKTHAIDDGARALLAAARKALPAGVYRWGDLEVAVDGARRFGWRQTTGSELAETAVFDGTRLVRRYAELGLDVTRSYGEADVALAFAYLPIWVAEPAHYARWFEVSLRGPRQIGLSRLVDKKAVLAYVIELDDQHRVIAIRDAANEPLIEVTWTAAGPAKARVAGEELALGFSAVPVPDAAAWAHGAASPGVVVEMPTRVPAFWDAQLKTLAEGSAEWRHAHRQRLASLAAINGREGLAAGYDALRTHGGVALGDVVLASAGLATATTDAQFAAAVAPPEVTGTTAVAYLRAGRLYRQAQRSDRLKATTSTGLVGALWTLREAVALMHADKDTQGVDRLLSLGNRAFDLRLVGASVTTARYRMKPADIQRAWDSVAEGDFKNAARAHAATVLANRGLYDAAAERVTQLVRELDLAAAPPNLAQHQYWFRQSRRGNAGWQLVWTTWRDRVLAGSSFDHVMSLLLVSASQPQDVQVILARAAALAGGDPDRVLGVARYAMRHGQAAFGQALIEPLVKQRPTRELLQLAAAFAVDQGRHADALAHLEAAQTIAADEAVNLSTVRAELAQILTVARQLAMQSQGAARDQAVARAVSWGAKWRAIDPGNAQVDQVLGELMLAVGKQDEAWRYLSSAVERDPMSGDGYQLVATAFEGQGRVAEALDYWHQAAMLDQTNPTPRLREAQALIALGRTAEGDKLLAEIGAKKWHARWEGVAYQARYLLEQAKRQQEGRGWDE